MKCPECGSKNVKLIAPWSESESRNLYMHDYECQDCLTIFHSIVELPSKFVLKGGE